MEALYLEFLGRLPEEKGLEHYVKNLEAGEMTLEEVKKAVANSPEASEWAQQRQQERSKSPVRRMMRGVLESMKAAQDGQLLGDLQDRPDLDIVAAVGTRASHLLMGLVESPPARSSGSTQGLASVTCRHTF